MSIGDHSGDKVAPARPPRCALPRAPGETDGADVHALIDEIARLHLAHEAARSRESEAGAERHRIERELEVARKRLAELTGPILGERR